MKTKPRLVIADDHRMVVQGLEQGLRRHYEIVGVAYSGDELVRLLQHTTADCLILDLSLPGRNGLEILPDIRRAQPKLMVLVVTMHADRVLAEAALAAGATGFVPKDAAIDELEAALGTVLKGQRYVSPRVPKVSHRLALDAMHASLARLTPRQQEILALIAQGKSSEHVGEALGLTKSTITFHRARIRAVLGLSTEWELLRYAILVSLATSTDGADSSSAIESPRREHSHRVQLQK